MSYLSQSSRITFLLIQLKSKALITPDQYSRLCDYAANDNPQLKQLINSYENGLSQSDLIDQLSKMLITQNGNENIIKSYFDSIIIISKQLKSKIKEFYREIKQDINHIYKECFLAQQQEVKNLIRLILKQFYIQEFSLVHFNENQYHFLTNSFESIIIQNAQDIQQFTQSQSSQQFIKTSSEFFSLLKIEKLPQYFVISNKDVFFFTFADKMNSKFKQYFMITQLYKHIISILKQGCQILILKKLQAIRMEILQIVSQTIYLQTYKLVFHILIQIMKQFNLPNFISQNDNEQFQKQELTNYLMLIFKSEWNFVSIDLDGNLSDQLKEKIKSTFKKSIKRYSKKLKQKKNLLESFQQVTQHNEMIMCLFFNNFLQLYYITVQWNHDQFVSRFKLSKEINYGDAIYKIFEKNQIIILKVKELIESKNDHLEFNDGFYKFSMKVERSIKQEIKQISVYLFNMQLKRPLNELLQIFRRKVKILLTLKRATMAFKQKQLIMENQFFQQSALVMYLPDNDMRRLTRVYNNNDQLLEKYRAYIMKKKQKKLEQILAKYQEKDKKNPEGRQISIDPNLQQKLLDYEFNLLNKKQFKNKFTIVYNIFDMCEYGKQYPIKNKEFINFLTALKYKYNKTSNPFHNFTHGVNVMHGCFLFAHHQKFGLYFNDLQRYAMTLGGLCHDVGHPGMNNLFQINAQTKLTLIYNDKSVLENHHIAVTYQLLALKQCDFLVALPRADKLMIRKYIVNNVLATDNQYHFKLSNDIEIRFAQSQGDPKIFQSEENKILLSGYLTHAADFFGAAKSYQISRQWSEKLRREFQAQSQLEDIVGIAQTPYLRNLDDDVQYAKNEVGFLKVIVKPIYESLNQFSDGAISLQLANINLSIKKYQEIVDSQQS
ncbi:unnamed protein product [Paramecium sonneborni]|uniref:Phosphodiesterase n=1 Tax=Paramecium sonneborni TaxID=65129 RepID=A0A8S1P5I7_9CILI|nr:unnamed protein product [Paramecium sonneborni]